MYIYHNFLNQQKQKPMLRQLWDFYILWKFPYIIKIYIIFCSPDSLSLSLNWRLGDGLLFILFCFLQPHINVSCKKIFQWRSPAWPASQENNICEDMQRRRDKPVVGGYKSYLWLSSDGTGGTDLA